MSSIPPSFEKGNGRGGKIAIIVMVVVGVIVVAVVVLLMLLFVGALLITDESGSSSASVPRVVATGVPTAVSNSWADAAFLGAPFPKGMTTINRYSDERGIDAYLLLSFETTDAEAVTYVTAVTGIAPAPGFSLSDSEQAWWSNRPPTGRGAEADVAKVAMVKRVLLSDPDTNGNTVVWVEAHEL